MPTTTRRALADSALALLVATVAAVQFMPPLLAGTVGTPVRALGTALVLALALPLHWLWLAGAARRLGLSVRGWLALALLFPVGGAAALLLLMGLVPDEPRPAAAR